jgi:hypothetical protein
MDIVSIGYSEEGLAAVNPEPATGKSHVINFPHPHCGRMEHILVAGDVPQFTLEVASGVDMCKLPSSKLT